MNLLDVLKKFLEKNLNKNKPILLGFSNGVDSALLFDLLLKCKKDFQIDLHVAHVNHNFRKESDKEAEIIRKKISKLDITFHYKKINFFSKKNLENFFRNERFAFFKNLFEKYDFQALLLAHQKDDLAETVLKRFLEGSNIFSMSSMQEVSKFENMIIWRPLLKVTRKEIFKYLEKNNINYFEDRTNCDTKYLRAKMRYDIFPYLQKNFNKEIINNLSFISSSSFELNNYLDKKTKVFCNKIQKCPLGIWIDLNDVNECLELKYIIKKIAFEQKIELSRDLLSQLSDWIIEKKANFSFKKKEADICADRGHFFILKKKLRPNNDFLLLKEGLNLFNGFQIDVKKVTKIDEKSLGWFDIFLGTSSIYLPQDNYFVKYPSQNAKLKKRFENSKIPAFLRRLIPVVYNQKEIIYDFLTKKMVKLNHGNILKISLILK